MAVAATTTLSLAVVAHLILPLSQHRAVDPPQLANPAAVGLAVEDHLASVSGCFHFGGRPPPSPHRSHCPWQIWGKGVGLLPLRPYGSAFSILVQRRWKGKEVLGVADPPAAGY